MIVLGIILSVAALILCVLKVMAIIKATKDEFSSVIITMFRGFRASALLKEKQNHSIKLKKLIITNSSIDILLLIAIMAYFVYALNNGTSAEYTWALILGKLANDIITDWQIKRVVNESS